MAGIVDMVRTMKQMHDAAISAYTFSDLHAQIAKATEQACRMPDVDSYIARATAQFRTVDEILQKARSQMVFQGERFGT